MKQVSEMINLLLVILLLKFAAFSEQRSIPAHCKKEFLDPVNVAKAGYCWKFNPHVKKEKDAANYCKQLGGHLVTVNTKRKAKLLGQFIKDSLILTAKDYFGKKAGRYHRKYMGHNYSPWVTISSVYFTRSKITWTATGKEVGWEACSDRNKKNHSPGVKLCPAFTRIVNKWIYMRHCRYSYPFVCEQDLGSNGKHKAGSVKQSKARTTTTLKPTTTSTKATTTTTTTTTRKATTTRAPPPKTTTKPKSVTQKPKGGNSYYPSYYYYYDDYYYYK